MLKVLREVIYWTLYNHVCIHYALLQKYSNILSFHKGFEDAYYNEISGIGIPELLMNIVSCNEFEKRNTPTTNLTCRRNLVWYYLVYGTEVFQWNNFNRHRSITTILFRLNLVCKTSHYIVCIISMAQQILVRCMTLGWLPSCISTVMCSKNVYVRQM